MARCVSREVLKRSIDELAGAIGEALEDADAVTIRVSRPAVAVFERLKSKLGDKSKHLRHIETRRLRPDRRHRRAAVFETRMAEWAAALHEVLA